MSSFQLGIGPVSIGRSEDAPTLDPREARKLFRTDRRHAERREDTRFRRLIHDARAAGLHPLAAIGANMSAPVVMQDFQSAVSGGGSGGGGSSKSLGINLPTAIDKANLELIQKQTDFIQEQIDASKQARISAGLTNDKIPMDPDIKPPQFTPNRKLFGLDVISHPDFTDAQSDEDRSGEVVAAFKGIVNELADYKYTLMDKGGAKKLIGQGAAEAEKNARDFLGLYNLLQKIWSRR